MASEVGAGARAVLDRAARLETRARAVLDAVAAADADAAAAWAAHREVAVRRELAGIPVDRVREAAGGRLRTGPVQDAGYRTVLDLLGATPDQLDAVPPQLKPTVEAQAVARAHRMGHLRTVRVHRLLSPDSVDERLLEMLQHTQRLFDVFARRSAVAEAGPEAVDVSEADPARRVIALERDRLAYEPAAAS